MKGSGADKAWMQECMVPHWVRGGKDKAIATWNMGRITSETDQGIEEFGCYCPGRICRYRTKKVCRRDVIKVNSFDELEAKKDQLKGKIVFYNYKFNPRFLNAFQAYGDAVKYRGGGPSRAAQYGAIAVIVRSMTDATDNDSAYGPDKLYRWHCENSGSSRWD